MNRRQVLIGASATGLALLGLAGMRVLPRRPLALVYRGPASCIGCSHAVAALLRSTPTRFRTEFCGPNEETPISADSLASAAVYAQPGGGNVTSAWRQLRSHANDIRDFVHGGGNYLGFCLGAYLAGSGPGFALLPGDVNRYINTRQADTRRAGDTVLPVRWRGKPRHMYFQDGPAFALEPSPSTKVLATYDNGTPAAVIATYGTGRVGVVGPHPEADQSWYTDAELTNPDGIRFDLGYDLIESTLHNGRPAPDR